MRGMPGGGVKKPFEVIVRNPVERSETMCERCRAVQVTRCLLCCRDLCDECASQATCPNSRDGGHRSAAERHAAEPIRKSS